MSARDYLRERAAESRHNEMSAYLMFIAGSVLFVGGVLETLLVADTVEWIWFIPVEFSTTPGSVLGLALAFSGLALIAFGLVAGLYFSRDRAWYMRELRNTDLTDRSGIAKRASKKKRYAKRLR